MKKLNFLTLLFIAFSVMISAGNTDNKAALKEHVAELLQQQPVKFLENKGQMMDLQGNLVSFVLFKAEAPGVNVFITEEGLTLQTFTLRKEPVSEMQQEGADGKKTNKFFDWERIDIQLKGSSIQKENIFTDGLSTTGFNFFYGHCPDGIYGVKESDKITIKDVYPGIDWVLYNSDEKGFKYDFVIHPGADYRRIELVYKSKTPISINEQGEIELHTIHGNVKENTPVSFYEGREISTRFQQNYLELITINGVQGYETSIGFNLNLNLEQLDSKLTIDPQLVWGTMYGGNAEDGFMSLDTDVNGNVFVTGYTESIGFPVNNIPGSFFQGTNNGSRDAFVLKFNNSGILAWATYYGGSLVETANSVVCDPDGNVLVAGSTFSSDFPVDSMPNAFYKGTNGGLFDAFILKFDNSGKRLWATYYGGSSNENAYSITCDLNGNVYVTGNSSSDNFPLANMPGAFFQGTHGSSDAFVLKFDNAGNRLWATYYGGSSFDDGYSVACDLSGNLFVVGNTQSLNFPVDSFPGSFFQGAISANRDVFILKFDNMGKRLWATYYGGIKSDYGRAVACDLNGNVFVTGYSQSADFPVQDAGAFFRGTLVGNGDAFILKFDSSCKRQWATYYGGSDSESQGEYDGLAIDKCGNVYMGFTTKSTDVPTFEPACGVYFDDTFGGGTTDCFITKFTNTGSLLWASYIGGDNEDKRTPLAVDANNNLFMGGEGVNYEFSDPYTLPLFNPGGGAFYEDVPKGQDDSFILKFAPVLPSYSLLPVNATTCVPCNGSAIATITNCSISPYSYVWSNGTSTLNTTNSADTITSLCAGNYWVEITSNCLIDTLFFTITAPGISNSIADATICQGDSILLEGAFQTAPGTYKDTIFGGSSLGCDSVITTTLTVNPVSSFAQSFTGCPGFSVSVGINTYSTTGAFSDTLTGSNGCDSIVSTSLTISIPGASTQSITECEGFSVSVGINTYSTTGVFSDTLIGSTGCDSIVTTTLTINTPLVTTQSFTECEGFSITVGPNTYTATGVFSDVLNGCDTIITDLTINPTPRLSFFKTDDYCEENNGSINALVTSDNPPIVYNWNNGSNDSIINNLPKGTYVLIITDGVGCSDTDTITINNIEEDCDFVYAPNTFSPNGDDLNEMFLPLGLSPDVEQYEFFIFDRWGNLIFKSTNPAKGWDGRANNGVSLAQIDTYVWRLKYTDGENRAHKRIGHVNLIR